MSVIMALDLATTFGVAVGHPGRGPLLQSIRLPPARGEYGPVFAAFADQIADLITVHQPSYIGFEAPMPRMDVQGINAGRLLLGMVGVLELVCYRREIPLGEKAVTTVRKFFCASGRAKKDEVMAECRRRGWAPPDHNAADAAAVWAFTCHHRAPVARAA